MQQVTAAEPSPPSCDFAGSAFCRKVREELSVIHSRLTGHSGRLCSWPLVLRAAPRDPAVTGPACPGALGGHTGEDGASGWSLGW